MKLAMIALVAACAKHGSPAPELHVDPTTTQLVTAIVDGPTATRATLRLWHREASAWRADGEPWPAVVGAAGVAGGERKREGDRKSPTGVFPLRAIYGYAAAPPPGTRLPYTQTDASWQCVDDPGSTHYAQVLDRRTVAAPDWKSAEDMRRSDELYTWVVDTGFNAAQQPAAGSCIFLHVWRGPDAPTVGCTAMAEAALEQLIARLDPAAHPAYVLLTRDEYRAVAERAGLPSQ